MNFKYTYDTYHTHVSIGGMRVGCIVPDSERSYVKIFLAIEDKQTVWKWLVFKQTFPKISGAKAFLDQHIDSILTNFNLYPI